MDYFIRYDKYSLIKLFCNIGSYDVLLERFIYIYTPVNKQDLIDKKLIRSLLTLSMIDLKNLDCEIDILELHYYYVWVNVKFCVYLISLYKAYFWESYLKLCSPQPGHVYG